MSAATRDDWELLGLAPGAPAADVRAAYRRLAKQTHPDSGGTAALFRQLEDAYTRILGDPTTTSGPDQATRPDPAPSDTDAADAGSGPGDQAAGRRRGAGNLGVALWVVFCAGSWPRTLRSSAFAVALATLLAVAVHATIHIAVISDIVAAAPILLVAGRIIGRVVLALRLDP